MKDGRKGLKPLMKNCLRSSLATFAAANNLSHKDTVELAFQEMLDLAYHYRASSRPRPLIADIPARSTPT